MQRIAFQRQCEAQHCSSIACRINALASLCICFFAPRFSAPLHVLWPLIPRSAGHIPAIPTPFFAPPPPRVAVLLRCNFSLCRAFPSQSTALPLLSASVPLHIGASPLQIAALRSFAIARLLDARRCNSSAIRVTAILQLLFAILSASIAHLCGTNRFCRGACHGNAPPLPLCAMPLSMRRSSSRASRPPTRRFPCPSCATGTARASVRSSGTP